MITESRRLFWLSEKPVSKTLANLKCPEETKVRVAHLMELGFNIDQIEEMVVDKFISLDCQKTTVSAIVKLVYFEQFEKAKRAA